VNADHPLWGKRGPRRWITRLVGVVVLVTGYFGFAHLTGIDAFAPFDNPGDPGGRIMAQLMPVVNAVPMTAHVDYVEQDESHQDSCDGMDGTFGWDPLYVQKVFKWNGGVSRLFQIVNQRLAASGWKFNGGNRRKLHWWWRKKLSTGYRASANMQYDRQLLHEWTINTAAPAALPPPSGC
jgi:hypothetical protein